MSTAQLETVKLKPLADRVLVKRLEAEGTLKGGIILPDSAKKKQESARVYAVGEGKKNSEGKLVPVPVQVGNVILMDKYSGTEVTVDGEEYIIVRSDDIIAIVEE